MLDLEQDVVALPGAGWLFLWRLYFKPLLGIPFDVRAWRAYTN